MAYEFKITRRVEFSDTDLAGIMHFSNYFRFMETAEHAFFRSLGFSVVRSRPGRRLCLPRVHADCDFYAPLCFEDEVLVHLLVEKKSARSLTCQFRFSRLHEQPALEVARGRVTVVGATRKPDGALKSIPLPKIIFENIQEAPPRLLAVESRPIKPSSGSVVVERLSRWRNHRGRPRRSPSNRVIR
jgi:acyl-CoA thioester hydrolase